MTDAIQNTGKGKRWAGYILSGLPAIFLILDAVGKLFKPEVVVKGTVELGYPESVIVPLGILLLVCTIIYLIPQTAVLGAILLTGYLGGTVATHVRIGNPLFTHILFGVYLGVMLWLGIYFRESRLRQLVPLRSSD
ncbi:MAG: DoxX family protein [Acidobacteria bacterium]|nr:DoxX family protein [Acidobacteriota bacterium]